MKSVHQMRTAFTAAALLLLLGCPAFASAAGTNRFTAAIISKGEPSTNITRVVWHPSGRHVTYLRPMGPGDRTTNVLFGFDVAGGQERRLLDPPIGFFGTNRIRFSLSSYQWSRKGDALLLSGDDDLWLMRFSIEDRVAGPPRRLTQDAVAEGLVTFSPDGSRVAFVKTNNLFTIDLESGRIRQMTDDGSELVLNGRLDWVYGEEFSHATSGGRSYEWSPDGRRLAWLRLDDRPVPEHPITDFLRTHPTVRRQRYPKAGDTNPTPSVFVASTDTPMVSPRRMPLPDNAEYVVPEFAWTPDSREVAVLTLNRAQNDLSVHLWDGGRRRPRLLLRETDPSWINAFEPPRFLKDGRFLWGSERDGWYHCYLYQAGGEPVRQLTRGPWQIEPEHSRSWNERPFEADPTGQWLYFSGTEKDPRERHLYRVPIDPRTEPGRLERLSKELGTHTARLSPDGRYLLESFSAADRPPATRVLRTTNGETVTTLEQRADRWRNFATASFEFHEVTAADGVKLYGQLIKPASFQATKKYPVIVYVYGGPHAQVVRHQWHPVSGRHHLLAQEGFLVWSLDNRGSWGRGRAWETAIHRNCGTNELTDQLAGVAYLKTLPFVDTNRFGIWGWSYGGYMTLYALTHAPEVFKCGVAGAPVTDWKYYDTIYTERYMSTPKDNPSGYLTSSPLEAATRLKARLLLIHGTGDDNVHLQNTMSFVNALVKAGRPYELQIQPGQGHGFGGEAATTFVTEHLVEFFKRNL